MARKKKTRLEKEADPEEDNAWDEDEEPPPKTAKNKKKKEPAPTPDEESAAILAQVASAVESKRKKNKKRPDAPEADKAEEPIESPPKKKQKKDVAGGEKVPESESGPGGTVFVGGIPWSVTEETFREDFSECGEISEVNFMKNKETGLFKGTAFVTFAYKAGVDAALAYNNTDYGGRMLKVNVAEDKPAAGKDVGDKGKGKGGKAGREREVFIKGLPLNLMEGALKDYFAPCGDIEKISMPLRDDGRCKGFAWIVFVDGAGVEKASELNGKEFAGKMLLVEKSGLHLAGDGAKGKGKGKEKGKGKGSSELEVFVKNLPFDIDEPTLQRDFAECGEIERINVPMKDQERCMGFAWITFKTKEGMEKAIAFDGDDYGGRRLVVEQSGKHLKGAGKGKDKND